MDGVCVLDAQAPRDLPRNIAQRLQAGFLRCEERRIKARPKEGVGVPRSKLSKSQLTTVEGNELVELQVAPPEEERASRTEDVSLIRGRLLTKEVAIGEPRRRPAGQRWGSA